jgi:DedD protein
MNEKFKQRLVGLIVVLALLFGLSWLLPRQTGGGDRDVSSTVVPLSTIPVGRSNSTGSNEPADSSKTDELGDAEGAPQIPPEERVPPREWGKRRANASGQTATADAELGADQLATPPAIRADKTHVAESKPKPNPPATPAMVNSTKPAPPVVTANTDRLQPFPLSASAPSTQPAKPASASPAPKPVVAATSSPPTAPPPVSSSATNSSDAKIWYVQIGSFADQNNAQTTLSLMQNIGYHGESSPITNASGKRLYRVRLGPFPNEAAARAAQDKIAHQGYPQSRAIAENSNGR